MKIDYTAVNSTSGALDAFVYCSCNGDPECDECDGLGHILVPLICIYGCGEAFDTLEELDKHMQTVHKAYPLTIQ